MTDCLFDPAIFDPAIFDECVPVTTQPHAGLIAPWVQRPADRGLLYPPKQPVLVLFVRTTQPLQEERIVLTNREDEAWLLLT